METTRPTLETVLTTPHPARPYFVMGGVLGLYGLVRSGFSGLLLLGAGGALLAKGLEEMRRLESLHGGNAHGTNAPPLETMEEPAPKPSRRKRKPVGDVASAED